MATWQPRVRRRWQSPLLGGGGLTGANTQVWIGVASTELGLSNATGWTRHVEVTATGGIYRVAVANSDRAVEHWDGSSWQQLGPTFSYPLQLQSLPTGDIVIAGERLSLLRARRLELPRHCKRRRRRLRRRLRFDVACADHESVDRHNRPATSAIIAITSTNALDFLIGSY